MIGNNLAQNYVERKFNDKTIQQRTDDGFFNATAMCQATNKRWNDYYRLENTQAFIHALSPVAGIPATEQNQQVIKTIQGGIPENQGTWVHPYVAINLAQWCSPEFAVQVSKWVFELMSTGHVEITPQAPSLEEQIKLELLVADRTGDMLRLSESGKLGMAQKICQAHGLSTTFLPCYAEEKLTKALTTLLKEGGYTLTARKVNSVLIELGLIEIQTRPSTKAEGKTKEFKSLTEAGLKYGKNLTSPQNQKETQPHFFIDTFDELMEKVLGDQFLADFGGAL
jgi:hypothetical protein